jgi:hypothetical protein
MDYGRGNLMTRDTFGTEERIGHPARQRVIETSRWLSGHADADGLFRYRELDPVDEGLDAEASRRSRLI